MLSVKLPFHEEKMPLPCSFFLRPKHLGLECGTGCISSSNKHLCADICSIHNEPSRDLEKNRIFLGVDKVIAYLVD